MLRAIINAIMSVLKSAGHGIDWFLSIFGIGGGGETAQEINPAKMGLPELESLQEARQAARAQQSTADMMIGSALSQVRAYAAAQPSVRLEMPVDKLTIDQSIWLMKLTERELSLIVKATDRRVQAALDGEIAAIDGVRPIIEPKKEDNLVDLLGARLAAAREKMAA